MALTAVPVGFVAGLFGIGGGLITVPFLYYIFGSLGIDQQYIMHLAVGTFFFNNNSNVNSFSFNSS
jgi:uncharacterized membrane protein YfcA